MDKQKQTMLNILKTALIGETMKELPEDVEWAEIIHMAQQHSVLSLLYDALCDCTNITEGLQNEISISAQKTVQQSYRLLFLSNYLITSLADAGISVVLLKGVGTASYYNVPELRKSGDVDLLLLDSEKEEDACKVLENLGCKKINNQPSLHHIVFSTAERIEVELHTMLAEPFDNQKMNQYLEEIQQQCKWNVIWKDCMGIELPVLQIAYHGYELLLHMLQHFLRSGFGLKLLCDWVVFWKQEVTEQEQNKYLQLIGESGLKGFSDMITLCCCKYLGLERRYIEWMQLSDIYDTEGFIAEILEAEEFGKSSGDRMVTLRGTKLTDYIREFHHQMCLNFPKKSKVWLYWPILWVLTLYRFLRNNRKIRKTSSLAIFKKAKQRSRMVEQIKLFEK